MEIKIKYQSADMPKIEKISQSDWIDLRAAETVTMSNGEFRVISLGISMELPDGYEAHVAPRSSTFSKWGVIQANGLGIIDNSYKGNNDIWRFPAICLKETGTTIHKGDRICQFRIVKKQPEIEFIEVSDLNNENRGGFGSTGSK